MHSIIYLYANQRETYLELLHSSLIGLVMPRTRTRYFFRLIRSSTQAASTINASIFCKNYIRGESARKIPSSMMVFSQKSWRRGLFFTEFFFFCPYQKQREQHSRFTTDVKLIPNRDASLFQTKFFTFLRAVTHSSACEQDDFSRISIFEIKSPV